MALSMKLPRHLPDEPVLDKAKENMEAIGCGEEYFAGKIFTADRIIRTQRT